MRRTCKGHLRFRRPTRVWLIPETPAEKRPVVLSVRVVEVHLVSRPAAKPQEGRCQRPR